MEHFYLNILYYVRVFSNFSATLYLCADLINILLNKIASVFGELFRRLMLAVIVE